MSARLGIAVSRTELRAVVVRGGRIVWHARSARKESIEESLDRLLASARLGRIRKPRVSVAIGAADAQVKQIERLPEAKQLGVLKRVVRENAESFFLRGSSRLTVTDLERRPDGTTWAAAFDSGVVDELLTAFRKRGLSRVTIVPFAVAVAAVVPHGVLHLTDDGVNLELTTVEGGRLKRVRRLFEASPVDTPAPPALSSLGSEAWDFASAYGSALVSTKASLAWRPEVSAAQTRASGRTRVAAAAALLAASLVGAMVAPGVRALRLTQNAARELAVARSSQIEAARIEGELRRVSAQLERIERFRASRGGMTLLLGALSQSLPESTALVSLRVDTLEGSFVALSPHAADILPQLTSIEPLASPRFVGSVTRETQGMVRLERATIRFRRAR